MKLNKVERLLLANQYLILSKLDPSNADEYDTLREALENGYEAAYEDTLGNFIFDGFPESECVLVQDAMDLYWTIQSSYDTLEDKAGIEERRTVFPGFDGNHETAYMTYARYLAKGENKLTSLKARSADFNSHSPMRDRYRRKIDLWKSMGEKLELTAEDIAAILER